MLTDIEFILPDLTKSRKKALLGYATQVLEAQKQMTGNQGTNILHYTRNTSSTYERMSHYPKGDRIDHQTGSQYFYHCHRENPAQGEHGHFHNFIRYKQVPPHIKPTSLSDWDKYMDNPMTHLVAIGMSQFGQPIRLFTVNRWVTSEIWYDAAHIEYFIKNYKMTLNDSPYWQVLDRWIEGMLHLFSPQISWLNRERERKILQYQISHPNANPYIEECLEELSEIPIDLKEQIEWLIS